MGQLFLKFVYNCLSWIITGMGVLVPCVQFFMGRKNHTADINGIWEMYKRYLAAPCISLVIVWIFITAIFTRVPKLCDETVDSAVGSIHNASLEARVLDAVREDGKVVVYQSEPAGTIVRKRTIIDIASSAAPEKISIVIEDINVKRCEMKIHEIDSRRVFETQYNGKAFNVNLLKGKEWSKKKDKSRYLLQNPLKYH